MVGRASSGRVFRVAASAAVVAAGAGACAVNPAGSTRAVDAPAAPARATTSTRATTVPAGPAPALIATLSTATGYASTPGGPVTGTLAATNPFGQPQTLAVVGSPSGGWLHVELPVIPDGTTGWISASAARLTQTSYEIVVSLAARTLTVTDAGRTVLTTRVGIGAPTTPTPRADTYLWELVRPSDPAGPYGPYIFGLALFSDALSMLNGGIAQIAIHGQDEPWSIGEDVSLGCVRLPDDVMTRLAGMLPLGTPVVIE